MDRLTRYIDAAQRLYHAALASGDPDQMERSAKRIQDTADRHTGPVCTALLNIAARLWDEAILAACCG